jgi:hypothetical protein
MRLLVILLLAMNLAVAQAPQPAQKIRIEGRVVSVSGEPLSKATLTLMGPGPPIQEAGDNEGRFIFENLPAGW